MSEPKQGLAGLFVNKKAAAPAGAPMSGGRPKNVKQRWMIISVATVGFVVVSASFFGKKPEPVTTMTKSSGDILVTPAGVGQKDWISQSSERLRANEALNQKLENKLATMEQSMLLMKEKEKALVEAAKNPVKPDATASVPGNIVPPPVMGGPVNGLAGIPVPPSPPLPPTSGIKGTANSAPALQLPPAFGAPPAPLQEAQIFKPEARAATSGSTADGESVKANIKYKKNQYSGFLPAGSFAPVVLLNGLDAGTSSATQANPMPVLMTVTDQATLPGSAKYTIKSCFVLGTGYGDLSAERVYVRYSRMSCVDKQDRLVLSADVSGYLVDSDGKIGLRGKVLDRQGAKLGKALLAGFAQGLSGALGTAQSTVTTTALGATSALGGGDALKASGLSGAQSAAQQLAQFYLKEAQSIFPVISIDTGRTGTIVFTDNASLTWSAGDAQYVKDVKPE